MVHFLCAGPRNPTFAPMRAGGFGTEARQEKPPQKPVFSKTPGSAVAGGNPEYFAKMSRALLIFTLWVALYVPAPWKQGSDTNEMEYPQAAKDSDAPHVTNKSSVLSGKSTDNNSSFFLAAEAADATVSQAEGESVPEPESETESEPTTKGKRTSRTYGSRAHHVDSNGSLRMALERVLATMAGKAHKATVSQSVRHETEAARGYEPASDSPSGTSQGTWAKENSVDVQVTSSSHEPPEEMVNESDMQLVEELAEMSEENPPSSQKRNYDENAAGMEQPMSYRQNEETYQDYEEVMNAVEAASLETTSESMHDPLESSLVTRVQIDPIVSERAALLLVLSALPLPILMSIWISAIIMALSHDGPDGRVARKLTPVVLTASNM